MKKINEEILRIHKIMNIKSSDKQIVSEQFGLFKKLGVTEFADDLEKIFKDEIDELSNVSDPSKKLSFHDAEKLKSFIDDPKVRNAGPNAKTYDDLITKHLGADASRESKAEYKQLISKLESNQDKTIQKFVETIYEKPNREGSNFYKDIFGDVKRDAMATFASKGDGEITDVNEIYRYFTKKLNELVDPETGKRVFDNLGEMADYLTKTLDTDPTFRKFVKKQRNKFKKLPTWVDNPDIGIGVSDMEGIPLKRPTLIKLKNRFKYIYTGYIQQIKTLGRALIKEQDQAAIVQRFNQEIKASFDEVLKSSSSDVNEKLGIYKIRITQSFLELGDSFEKSVNYKSLWDTLRSNITREYSGDELKQINEFLDSVYTLNAEKNPQNQWYYSIKNVCDDLSGGGGGIAFANLDVEIKESIGAFSIKVAQQTVKEEMPSFWKNLLFFYGTGFWGSPKQMMRHFAARGYKTNKLLKLIIYRFFIINVVIPFAFAGLEWLGDNLLKKIEDKFKVDMSFLIGENDINSEFETYFYEYLSLSITQGGGMDTFWDTVSRLIPGWIDNTVISTLRSAKKAEKINTSKFVTPDMPPEVDDVINKVKKVKSDLEVYNEILKIASPTLVDVPGTVGARMYQEIKRTTKGSIDDKEISKIKPYFFLSDKNGDYIIYFFLKGSTEKKLELRRTDIYQGKIAQGTVLSAKDETGNPYNNTQMTEFVKHLISLIDKGGIVGPSIQKAIKIAKKEGLNITPESNGTEKNKLQTSSIILTKNNILKEMEEGKKFGEDNFKHWKDTFKFKKHDEKTGQLKDVKITSKMDEIMDRIDHFRKKYDEDDSFVRAVIDVFGTGIDVIQYTKGLAHLTEGVIVGGLLGVLANIRESKELVTWTVKHYNDGNWELVKGNFNKKELLNVGKTKQERDERQKELENPAEGLKKKELESIMVLKRDEKEGLNGLPTKVKEKIKEKLRQGWTTETPFDFLSHFYTESEINSVFNEKIKIYKLKPSLEFFRSIAKNSAKINLKKGFCKSLKNAEVDYEMSQREKNVLQNFISKCESKFGV